MSLATPIPILPSLFSGAIENGRWQPGIGDPTPMGWVTTIAYFLGALLCLWRAWTAHRDSPQWGRPLFFWTVCGALMLLLCINKQLDLQTFVTQTGRDWAKTQGWYENRRAVQSLFIKGLAATTAGALLVALWFIRGLGTHYYLSLFGLVFTGCFVIVRAASMHHVDQFLGLHVSGLKMNWVLELGGILVVAMAALVPDRPPASSALQHDEEAVQEHD